MQSTRSLHKDGFSQYELALLSINNIPFPWELTPENIKFYNTLPKKIFNDYAERNRRIDEIATRPRILETLEQLKGRLLQNLKTQTDCSDSDLDELDKLVKSLKTNNLKAVQEYHLDNKELTKDQIERIFELTISSHHEHVKLILEMYNFSSAKGIDWCQHLDPKHFLRDLVERDLEYIRHVQVTVTLIEKAKFMHIAAKHSKKGGDMMCEDLISFRILIRQMEQELKDTAIVDSFNDIVIQIETELLEEEPANLNHYSKILEEFSNLANDLIKNKLNTDKLEVHATKLADLSNPDINADTPPMSPALKTKICLAIGMVFGAVIGFAIGAAITFWGAGFGGIAGAIAGATIAQSLFLGGTALVGAGIAGASASYIGYKHAASKHALFNATKQLMPSNQLKEKTNNAIKALR